MYKSNQLHAINLTVFIQRMIKSVSDSFTRISTSLYLYFLLYISSYNSVREAIILLDAYAAITTPY